MLSTNEIERRKPVWLAISEFYLDTELDNDDLSRISNIFKESGYSINELKDIDFFEVSPIVGANLMSIAGIWDGFDQQWLWNEIISTRLVRKRSKHFLARLKKKWFLFNCSGYWKKISI